MQKKNVKALITSKPSFGQKVTQMFSTMFWYILVVTVPTLYLNAWAQKQTNKNKPQILMSLLTP
jgi:hypothetical protein